MSGKKDFLSIYQQTDDLYEIIISIIHTLPGETFVLLLILLTMIAFYATSFDSIAYIGACYTYYQLEKNEMPSKWIELLWCVLLIILPISLLFSESSMRNLQSVSIIAAFPIGIVIILIIISFMKDANDFLKENT